MRDQDGVPSCSDGWTSFSWTAPVKSLQYALATLVYCLACYGAIDDGGFLDLGWLSIPLAVFCVLLAVTSAHMGSTEWQKYRRDHTCAGPVIDRSP